jgi:hypothetical protein
VYGAAVDKFRLGDQIVVLFDNRLHLIEAVLVLGKELGSRRGSGRDALDRRIPSGGIEQIAP